MKVIRPHTLELLETNVPDCSESDWDSETTYLLDDKVVIRDTSPHTIYKSLRSNNLNKYPPDWTGAIREVSRSTTSVAVGTGEKTFTVETDKGFGPGMEVMIEKLTTPRTVNMTGEIISYNISTGSLVVSVYSATGEGSHNQWTIKSNDEIGYWEKVEATNRYKMLDEYVNTQTETVSGAINFKIKTERFDYVSLINLDATEVEMRLLDDERENKWVQTAPKLEDEIKILSSVVYNDKIYCGTGTSGKLLEWNGTDAWVVAATQFEDIEEILSLVVYNDKIYGGTGTSGKLLEWNGTNAWVAVTPQFENELKINSLVVYNDKIYGGTGTSGKLLEWNNDFAWVEVAPQLETEDHIYSLVVYKNQIYGGTYPNGKLFKWNGVDAWVEVAPQLEGQSTIYSLVVYNNKIYGGTAPNGKLFEWNGTNAWFEVAPQLGDQSAIYSLVVYNYNIYGGTGPNGKLFEWNTVDAWKEVAPQLEYEAGIYTLSVFNNIIYGGTGGVGYGEGGYGEGVYGSLGPNTKLVEWNGSRLLWQKTIDLVYGSTIVSMISDWFEYFIGEYSLKTDIATEIGVLIYSGSLVISIRQDDESKPVKIGNIVAGRVYDIGGTRYGLQAGIIDFSERETDEQGRAKISQGYWAKRTEASLYLKPYQMTPVYNVLTSLRGVPTVWIGIEENGYELSLVYGTFRNFDVIASGPHHSFCNLEIEGLI